MYLEILNRFYDIEADVKDLEKVWIPCNKEL